MSEKELIKKSKLSQRIGGLVSRMLSYTIAISFFLVSITFLGFSSASSILVSLAGLITLPPVYRILKRQFKTMYSFDFKRIFSSIIVFSLCVISFSILISTPEFKEYTNTLEKKRIIKINQEKDSENEKSGVLAKTESTKKNVKEEVKIQEPEKAQEIDTINNQTQTENRDKPDLENLVSKVIIKKDGNNFIFENKNNYEIRLRNILGSFQSNSTWEEGGNTLFSQVKWSDSFSRNDGGSVVIDANSKKEIPFSDFEYNVYSIWSKADNNKNKPHEFSCLYYSGFVAPSITLNKVFEFNNKVNVFCQLPLP
jgi:hypothetical protein